MRKMRFQGDSGGIPDPSGQGPGTVGPFDCPVALEPPPGTPIRTAWVAGRLGIAFTGEDGAGLDPRGDRVPLCLPAAEPPEQLNPFSLTAIEALDVEERPYIWDL